MAHWIEIGFVILVIFLLLHVNEVRSEANAAKQAVATNIVSAGRWLEGKPAQVVVTNPQQQQVLVDETMQYNCLKAFRACMLQN